MGKCSCSSHAWRPAMFWPWWQCCGPTEEIGSQMEFHSTTDEVVSMPHLLPLPRRPDRSGGVPEQGQQEKQAVDREMVMQRNANQDTDTQGGTIQRRETSQLSRTSKSHS